MRPVEALRELRRFATATRADLQALREEVAQLHAALATLDQRAERTEQKVDKAMRLLRSVHDDENAARRRLAELRETPEYERAYSEPEPLVSVIIPTYTNHEMLRTRALPSALAQTYTRLEIVIVGDAAPPETAEVVADAKDDRVTYFNLPVRGHYPEDPAERWLVAGLVPYNELLRRARGAWIAPFSDDDALRPQAVATMLEHAREHRLEGAYGVLNCLPPDGEPFQVGEYPPREGGVGLQGGIYHGGLRFFEQRLADAVFGIPNDWAMLRRMLRAGARWGFRDEVVCDYYPTSRVPASRGA